MPVCGLLLYSSWRFQAWTGTVGCWDAWFMSSAVCCVPVCVELSMCGPTASWRSWLAVCRNSSLVGGSYSDLTPSHWSCLFRSLWSRYWSSADLLLGIFATISRLTMQDMRFLRWLWCLWFSWVLYFCVLIPAGIDQLAFAICAWLSTDHCLSSV